MTKHIINVALTAEDAPAYAPAPHATIATRSFHAALNHDPIASSCSLVHNVLTSGQHHNHLTQVIEDGNKNQDFGPVDTPVIVPKVQLIRDMDTRWDSYFMIRRLRVLWLAIDVFLAHPKNKEIVHWMLDDSEWDALQDIEAMLLVPHKFQQAMSKKTTPILAGTIPTIERLMTDWEKLVAGHPHLAPFINKGLKKLRETYNNMDYTKAYDIAMAINPTVKFAHIRKHWDPDFIKEASQWVKEELQTYRATVSTVHTPTISRCSSGVMAPGVEACQTLTNDYGLSPSDDEDEVEAYVEQTTEAEMQAYLTSPCSPKGTSLLEYWGVNVHIYPTWFRIALDYLPIQASAVPCERVFSSSAQTDTTCHNCIKPELMEALQMLKFALKKCRLDFMGGWMVDESLLGIEESLKAPLDLLGELLEQGTEGALDKIAMLLADDDELVA